MADTKIKYLIAQAGMSVAAFAREVGIPQPTLHRIANGEVPYDAVSTGNFMKIAHGLGLSVEELYYDDPRYVSGKSEIDAVYSSTNREGRMALIACARGVASSYPKKDEGLLPTIEEGVPDFAVW